MDRLLFPLAAVLACGAAPARAADIANDASGGPEPIVVTGQQVKYGVRSTSTATKTETDVKDIPQALTTVTSKQIADQQLRSVGELLLYVPGASYNAGEGNRDAIVLRGNSSTSDFFVDGVRDDVQYFRDFYNVDRVEVLRGPNAMIFGRGGGGGIVNRVLKRPTLTPARALTASTDSWGDVRLTGDVDQPLGNIAGLRLNAMYEEGGSFRNHVDLHRYGLNPTVAVVSGSTRIDLSYEHFHDRRTADRGVPSDGNEPIRGFTRTFFGDPSISYARSDVDLGTLAIEHDFGGGLKLRNHTLLGDYGSSTKTSTAAASTPRRGWSRSAATITATIAPTCSARLTSSWTIGSPAWTRHCYSGSKSVGKILATSATLPNCLMAIRRPSPIRRSTSMSSSLPRQATPTIVSRRLSRPPTCRTRFASHRRWKSSQGYVLTASRST